MRGERNGRVAKTMRLVLPATHRDLRLGRNLLRRIVRMEGLAEREVDTLLLVASELLANAVDHGGGEGALHAEEPESHATMTLTFELDDERWRLCVEDQGGGDPDAVRALLNPDGPPDLEDERGRGFFLLSELVDELSAGASADGQGVALTAVHRHRPAAPDAGASEA